MAITIAPGQTATIGLKYTQNGVPAAPPPGGTVASNSFITASLSADELTVTVTVNSGIASVNTAVGYSNSKCSPTFITESVVITAAPAPAPIVPSFDESTIVFS